MLNLENQLSETNAKPDRRPRHNSYNHFMKTTMYSFLYLLFSPIIMDLIQHDFTMDSSRPLMFSPWRQFHWLGNSLCDPLLLGHRTSGVQIILQPMRWKCSSVYQDIWLQVTDTQLELTYTRFTIKTAVAITKQMIFTRKLLVPLAELGAEKPGVSGKPEVKVDPPVRDWKQESRATKKVYMPLSSSHSCIFLGRVPFPNVNQLLAHGWGPSLRQLQVHIFPALLPRKEPSSQLKYHSSISVKGKTKHLIILKSMLPLSRRCSLL